MLKAIETVTLVHHESANGQDAYTCFVCRGASWYWQDKTAVENGLRYARVLKCRIPMENAPAGMAATPGDRILRGEKESCTGAEFAALARHYEAATVLDVHRNTYGYNPHYYILGE